MEYGVSPLPPSILHLALHASLHPLVHFLLHLFSPQASTPALTANCELEVKYPADVKLETGVEFQLYVG